MKVKIFDGAAQRAGGKIPIDIPGGSDKQLSKTLSKSSSSSDMNTLVVPGPGGLPGEEASLPSVILFATLFYQ